MLCFRFTLGSLACTKTPRSRFLKFAGKNVPFEQGYLKPDNYRSIRLQQRMSSSLMMWWRRRRRLLLQQL